jgi:hypothetical protein
MPQESAFRHSASQSGTGAFWYRTGSPYSAALVQNPLKSETSSDFLFLFYPDSSPLSYFFIFAEFFRHLACYDLSLFSVTFCIFFVLCSNNSLAAVAAQLKNKLPQHSLLQQQQ